MVNKTVKLIRCYMISGCGHENICAGSTIEEVDACLRHVNCLEDLDDHETVKISIKYFTQEQLDGMVDI